MGENVSNVNPFSLEEQHGYQSVMISFDIKNVTVIPDVISGGHVFFQLVQVVPISQFHFRIPVI